MAVTVTCRCRSGGESGGIHREGEDVGGRGYRPEVLTDSQLFVWLEGDCVIQHVGVGAGETDVLRRRGLLPDADGKRREDWAA